MYLFFEPFETLDNDLSSELCWKTGNCLRGTGESYGPSAQRIRKIAQFSFYNWTMYIIENKWK